MNKTPAPKKPSHWRAVLAPIVVGLTVGTGLLVLGSIYVKLFRKFGLPTGYTVFIIISFGVALILLITVVIQRIRELKEEQDHDFSQY